MAKQYSLLEDMEDREIADRVRIHLLQLFPNERILHGITRYQVQEIGRAFVEEREEFNKRKEIEKVADYFETSGGESTQTPQKKQEPEKNHSNRNSGWPGESPIK